MARKVFLLDGDQVTLNWFSRFLRQTGYEVEAAARASDMLPRIASERPAALIMDIDLPDAQGLEVIRDLRVRYRSDVLPIIVLSAEPAVAVESAAKQAGADIYIEKARGADQEIVRALKTFLVSKTTSSSRVRGKSVCFFSAKGGNGTSVLCANIAQVFAQSYPLASVVVADLVLPLGSIGMIVGGGATDGLAKVTAMPATDLTADVVERHLSRPGGWDFRLLSGISNPEAAQDVHANVIPTLMRALRSFVDVTFVDVGRTLSRISLPIMEEAEAIVIVLSPEQTAVHLTKVCIDFLLARGVAPKRLFLIMNRAVGLGGMSKAEIEEELKLPIAGTVPYAAADFTVAVNQGQPFVARYANHSVTMMIEELTKELARLIGMSEAK